MFADHAIRAERGLTAGSIGNEYVVNVDHREWFAINKQLDG